MSTHAEKETRYIQHGRFFCFNSTVSYTYIYIYICRIFYFGEYYFDYEPFNLIIN